MAAFSAARHIPRKRFGQHFLTDRSIIAAIVEAIAPKPGQAMVEIGPGLAALTQPLAERLGRLCVIELDRDLAAHLRLHPLLEVIESDVLRVDFRQLAAQHFCPAPEVGHSPASLPKIRVVGNLPYNISTPILFHLLDAVDYVEDQHFMLQKEVVDRMVARPCTRDYGRLSVMLQWRYAMENVLAVPPGSFAPPPRVDSAVVRMVPLATPPVLDVQTLSQIVQIAFSQRRKLMRHTLGKFLQTQLEDHSRHPQLAPEVLAFDVQRRAEEVPVAEYVALAQLLSKAATPPLNSA